MGITSNGRVTNDIQTAIEKRFEIHENQGQSWFFFFALTCPQRKRLINQTEKAENQEREFYGADLPLQTEFL
ncbi:MAG: hypothetical protein IKP60_08545 [Treponema sp.]|nr:hypothetical protein [Treponema sp.]